MPINEKSKLVFIHIPKTGGTSIEEMFDIHKMISKKCVVPSPQHITGAMVLEKIGSKLWSKCYKFTIVRNPYTRILSEYNWTGGALYGMDFGSFIQKVRRIVREKRCYSKFKFDHFLPQHKFIEGVELDYIGKFEDYDSVVRQLEKQTGTTVKKVHTQSGKKKKTHLTKGEKDIVYDIYEKDFKIFGYAR